MAASLSSLTPFVKTYGSLFLPIAADLATTAVFKRMTSNGKMQCAGLAAGMGVLFFSGKQTSLVIGLTGTVLYLIYKVIATVRANPALILDSMMSIVEKQWLELQKALAYVSDETLDFKDLEFNTQRNDLAEKLEPQARPLQKMWENQDFLIKAQRIMELYQNFLFEIHTILEQQMLQYDPDIRSQKMADLLKDPSYAILNNAFDKAFTLLNEVYRMVRSKGYTISLPNIRNYPDRNYSMICYSNNITWEDGEPFFIDGTPQGAMNTIFNTTQGKLANLLQLLYPGSPLTAKDEVRIPGDYNNSSNPFKIKYA